jgi:hypothetical protein
MVKLKMDLLKTNNLSQDAINELNKLSIVYVHEDKNLCIIVRHDKISKEILRIDYLKREFTNESIFGVKLFDIYLMLENLNYYTEGDKINYMNYNLLTTLSIKQISTGLNILSLSLQNPKNKFIDYLILIPMEV